MSTIDTAESILSRWVSEAGETGPEMRLGLEAGETALTDDGGPALDRIEEMGDPAESVISAATLVCTAFRLRDEDALILTLRMLVAAIDRLESEG